MVSAGQRSFFVLRTAVLRSEAAGMSKGGSESHSRHVRQTLTYDHPSVTLAARVAATHLFSDTTGPCDAFGSDSISDLEADLDFPDLGDPRCAPANFPTLARAKQLIASFCADQESAARGRTMVDAGRGRCVF